MASSEPRDFHQLNESFESSRSMEQNSLTLFATVVSAFLECSQKRTLPSLCLIKRLPSTSTPTIVTLLPRHHLAINGGLQLRIPTTWTSRPSTSMMGLTPIREAASSSAVSINEADIGDLVSRSALPLFRTATG